MESQSSQDRDLIQFLNEELKGAIDTDPMFTSQDTFNTNWVEAMENDHQLFTELLTRSNSIDYRVMGEDEERLEIEADKFCIENPTPELYNQILSSVGLPSSSQQILQSQAVPNEHRNHYTDCRPNENLAVPDTTQGYGIPSNTNWLGNYNFDISFQEQTEKMTKSTSWTYSEQMDKLFVNMGVSCIVCFRVRKLPPPGCIIRALPIFEKCDHIRSVVKRCPTHCLLTDPSNQGHPAPEHLVRCDSEHADYVTDSNDGRHSVIVPFLPPQAGTDSTQYLYKFMCLGSCVGGLNRRPLQLIFTLEFHGKVLGRRTLKVRICACPGRDRKSEEHALVEGTSKKVKTLAQTTTADILVIEPASKRQKFDDEVFTLTIQGRANYELLLQLKESLELAAYVPNHVREAYQADQQEIIRPAVTADASLNVRHDRASTSSACPNEPVAALTSSSDFGQEIEASSVRKPNLQKMSSIRDEMSTSASSSSTKSTASTTRIIKTESLELVKSWLQSINMAGYVDLFAERGYKYMRQLEEMIRDDIDRLPIGDAHRQYIWKALLDYKGIPSCSPPSQASVSLSSQSSAVLPTCLHISRYKFKRVSSIKKTHSGNG